MAESFQSEIKSVSGLRSERSQEQKNNAYEYPEVLPLLLSAFINGQTLRSPTTEEFRAFGVIGNSEIENMFLNHSRMSGVMKGIQPNIRSVEPILSDNEPEKDENLPENTMNDETLLNDTDLISQSTDDMCSSYISVLSPCDMSGFAESGDQ